MNIEDKSGQKHIDSLPVEVKKRLNRDYCSNNP